MCTFKCEIALKLNGCKKTEWWWECWNGNETWGHQLLGKAMLKKGQPCCWSRDTPAIWSVGKRTGKQTAFTLTLEKCMMFLWCRAIFSKTLPLANRVWPLRSLAGQALRHWQPSCHASHFTRSIKSNDPCPYLHVSDFSVTEPHQIFKSAWLLSYFLLIERD